jgi:hypothetical protein
MSATEIKTKFLQPETLWETHSALLEDQERAWRNWDTLKRAFGEESEIAQAACTIHDATAELRSAMLDQMNEHEGMENQTEVLNGRQR